MTLEQLYKKANSIVDKYPKGYNHYLNGIWDEEDYIVYDRFHRDTRLVNAVINVIANRMVELLNKRGKTGIRIDKSPYSESSYVSYEYDGNYIQIRIAAHSPTKNDISDIHIII